MLGTAVKLLLLERPSSHVGGLLHVSAPLILIQLPAEVHAGKQQMIAQVFGSVTHVRDSEFWVLDCNLAKPWLLQTFGK